METTVVIVDDFPLAREGIASALAADPAIRVVGDAGTAAEAIARVRALEPDVALVDLRLPDGGGPDLIRALLAAVPSVSVLVLTAIEKVGTMRDVRDAGAAGYVTKRITARDLRSAIWTVRGGGTAFHLAGSADLLGSHPELSPD
jgi:DNA-binding NarL/FixJ family response regulator